MPGSKFLVKTEFVPYELSDKKQELSPLSRCRALEKIRDHGLRELKREQRRLDLNINRAKQLKEKDVRVLRVIMKRLEEERQLTGVAIKEIKTIQLLITSLRRELEEQKNLFEQLNSIQQDVIPEKKVISESKLPKLKLAKEQSAGFFSLNPQRAPAIRERTKLPMIFKHRK